MRVLVYLQEKAVFIERDRKKAREQKEAERLEHEEIPHYEETENALTKLIQSQETARMKKWVDQLPDNQRLALVMWLREEDQSYADLADELQMSESAFKSLLFRARRSLEKLLKDAKGLGEVKQG